MSRFGEDIVSIRLATTCLNTHSLGLLALANAVVSTGYTSQTYVSEYDQNKVNPMRYVEWLNVPTLRSD